MRVTFPRLPDHERGYALVERDDGVVYRLYGDMAGPRLPHDVRHLVVESELGLTDGIWGGIAAGVVFESMWHVSGRRPPRAAARSKALLRHFRERGLRAELMAVLVESVAALDGPSPEQIRLAGPGQARGAARRGRRPGRDRRGRPGAPGAGGPLGPAAGRGGTQLRVAAAPPGGMHGLCALTTARSGQ